MSKDPEVKMKALFAMGYRELYTASPNAEANLWYHSEWSSEAGDIVTTYQRQSPQFRAYQGLFDLVENSSKVPTYISKCDEFLQFRKYYRRNK